MIRGLRVVFACFALCIAVWALLTGIEDFSPYALFIISAIILFLARSELKANRKLNAILAFIGTSLILLVAIYSLI
ncbi:hypothetical protein LS684_08755 [Cytobacillus spongiae]|jgi:multisubunit Na+/H+ antiporter MnhE subunit|uniref:hypothetical protein n=1 Tax=Cytobacillus spongiae TaxID=2901381 RepID=UPI001F4614B8|nr:hypothetical protein [Cytobacillus spongiae]UII57504.1 hypothetical protein LS684_08755 [Cytobacillus spongiae]